MRLSARLPAAHVTLQRLRSLRAVATRGRVVGAEGLLLHKLELLRRPRDAVQLVVVRPSFDVVIDDLVELVQSRPRVGRVVVDSGGAHGNADALGTAARAAGAGVAPYVVAAAGTVGLELAVAAPRVARPVAP